MRKLLLIKNQELFQGEKYLKAKNKNYFEGWYFKNTSDKKSVSFIPGISINGKEKHAFIQVITNNHSYYVKYNIDDFKYSASPFYIKIANNFFSKNKICIDIEDNTQNLKIKGTINYSDNKNIKMSLLNPNIMGPFSYFPFMECNHAVISMKSKINGLVKINNKKIKLKNDVGYIEKDWGESFPKSYIWCQGNNFKNSNASFMLSIATTAFKVFKFKGLICSLIIKDKEYKFTTYNKALIKKCDLKDNSLDIILENGSYSLNIKSKINEGNKLLAPYKGKMQKNVYESISSKISVILKKDNKIIFKDTSTNCGLEIVK